jgi:hypothetical protein
MLVVIRPHFLLRSCRVGEEEGGRHLHGSLRRAAVHVAGVHEGGDCIKLLPNPLVELVVRPDKGVATINPVILVLVEWIIASSENLTL